MNLDAIEWQAFKNESFSFTNTNRQEEISGISEEMLALDGDTYNYEIDGILEHPAIEDIHDKIIAEIRRRCTHSSYPYQIDDKNNTLICRVDNTTKFYFFMLGLYLNKGKPREERIYFEIISADLVGSIMGNGWTVLRCGWPNKDGCKKVIEQSGITEIDESLSKNHSKSKDFEIDFLGYLNFFHSSSYHFCYKNSIFLFGQAASGKNYSGKIKNQSDFYTHLFKLRIKPLKFFTCCAVLSIEEFNEAAANNNICLDRLLLHEIYIKLRGEESNLEIDQHVDSYLSKLAFMPID